jgi:hypothetical protein
VAPGVGTAEQEPPAERRRSLTGRASDSVASARTHTVEGRGFESRPCDSVGPANADLAPDSLLQPVHVEALLRAVPDDELGATDWVLYLCAVTAGLRLSELLALKARRRLARPLDPGGDNLPRGPRAQVDKRKSHQLRSVPMADRLAGALERQGRRPQSRFHPPSVPGRRALQPRDGAAPPVRWRARRE